MVLVGLYAFSELVANYSRWLPLSVAPSPSLAVGGGAAEAEPHALNFAAHATTDRDGVVRVLLLLKDLESTDSVNATVSLPGGLLRRRWQQEQQQAAVHNTGRDRAEGRVEREGGSTARAAPPPPRRCVVQAARLTEPAGAPLFPFVHSIALPLQRGGV
eukprot:COSAG06_NODE_2236_length_7275_cov_86.121656_6_plen_159_part_00